MKKHILITGSTDGIGKLAADIFAQQGHSVYIHGRNEVKVQATVSELKASTQNNSIQGFVADLSNLNAVKQMSIQIKKEVSQIDVLINNAGVFKSKELVNNDGVDFRFAVNYLSPFLLTQELLPLLKKSNEPRIINLSSAAQSSISFEAMLGQKNLSVSDSYAQSKLAITMWSFYIAKQNKSVSTIAVNPGSLLNTKMANEAYGQHWSPAQKGADILVDLALNDTHKDKSGAYYDNDGGGYGRAHTDAYNQEAIQALIKFTDKLIN